jgi:hypothetical protein
MTMKSYGKNQHQAYVDLVRILDPRSGASREPLTLGDSNALGLFALLGIISWINRRFGLWRNITRSVQRTQKPVVDTIQTDELIRCQPATTWTETPTEYRSNSSPEPVNRQINSLYSPSNSPSNKLN